MFLNHLRRLLVLILGAFLLALSLNFFLEEANVYASGFTGIAQLITSIFRDFLGLEVGTGIVLFLLNIPVFIIGWIKLGKQFTIYSAISVGFITLFLEILPILTITEDIILNAATGGVIGGVGVGISLKIGASTGGMDIVAMVISRLRDKPIGIYILILNGCIVLMAGILYEPENALYTMLSLYVSTEVIDAIHTRHEKVTAMIITNKSDCLQKAIYEKMTRGITLLSARGAYTGEDRKMLYLVITRYELYNLEKIIAEVDPDAFTNIVQTKDVFGEFRQND